MSKKLFGLAPLIAIAAFAMPVTAQASETNPHWFSGTTRAKEGTSLPVIAWGAAANLKQESLLGEINCKTVGAGTAENPKGTTGNTGISGPAGVGKAIGSIFYECKEKECEKAIEESPLKAFGFKGVGWAIGQNLPWAESLSKGKVTGGKGEFSQVIGAEKNGNFGEGFNEGYPAESQTQNGLGTPWGATGAIGAIVGCEIFPNPEHFSGTTGSPKRVAFQELFEGKLTESIGGELNNTPTAAVPAEYELNGKESGALTGKAVGPATNTGNIKYLQYNDSPIKVEE